MIQCTAVIETIARESLAFLRERGDLQIASPTYAQRRRTADWIVRKSGMSTFFSRLGITNGCTIGTSFAELHDVTFFKAIYYLYVLHSYDTGIIAQLGGLKSLFNWKYGFRMVYRRLASEYYTLRKHIRKSIDISSGAMDDGESPESILEGLTSGAFGSYHSYKERHYRSGLAVPYIVAGALLGFVGDSEFATDARSMASRIEYELVHYGYCRNMLSFLHGYSVSAVRSGADCMVQGWQDADGSLIEYLFNGSHAMWNEEARLWQADQQRNLDLMRDWQTLDAEYQPDYPTDDMIEDLEDNEIYTTGAIGTSDVPPQVMRLANRLARKHGPVSVSKEAHGFHIYIPDPDLLERDGMKELHSKHLSINADRYLGINDYDIDVHPTSENITLYRNYRRQGKEVPSAISMKTKKVYMVSNLLSMAPLAERIAGLENVEAKVTVGSTEKRLVHDENGNLVPEGPGDVIPLTELPVTHPAVEYLRMRGFTDMEALVEQFNAGYCIRALPESRAEGRFYGRLPGGYRNCAEGRLIFEINMYEVREGWQARFIDKTVKTGGVSQYYGWFGQEWVPIRISCGKQTISETYPPDEKFPKGFAPHKYINATGSRRSRLLAGFDAALDYNATLPPDRRFCVLVEGVLDAARIGPPAIAMLGKFLSQEQAKLVRQEFSTVFVIPDGDAAGEEGLMSVITALSPMPVYTVRLPEGVKDAGDLTDAQAKELVAKEITPNV